jgi:hypothetical protein
MSDSQTSIVVVIAQNLAIIVGTLVVLNVAEKTWNKLRTKKQ